jgi:phenylpropionate dioxygenase-like ring-hydroxylating dioxygenase large terminal subunit
MNMLQGSPWLLAHRSMLKINQPIKVSLYGQDYVMWQDQNHEIHCLPNACPHLGAMLSEGWCAAKSDGTSTVVCPFHALEFDAMGSTVLPGSNKITKSLLKPLELIIQGDLIWSYGGIEPKISIPNVLNEIAAEYEFAGIAGERSVKTDLLTMLLNMHDYNHQNGTHRPLFEIECIDFKQFVDQGFHSHAYYDMPRAKPRLQDILKNPALLAMPKVIEAHLENYFPAIVIFHGETPIGTIKQCHVFVPESETQTRTFAVVFGRFSNPVFRLMKNNILKLVETVVEQDADILGKLYADSPQHIKLNNEIGMDWVRRNFESFPEVKAPNLSR